MFRLLLITLALVSIPASAASDAASNPSPAYVLELPPSVHTVLIAETDTATLHRYTHTGDALRADGERYMSVGQNGVGKERAGDRRTPLGIYFANDQLDTSRLHEKYGATAFPLDYPNAWDSRNDRSGDGIWIHGVEPGSSRRPPHDTDGCLALPNADVLELESHLELLITPVIITRRIRIADPAQVAATREELRAALDSWVRSFRGGDWHEYLSLYASDFSYRGLDKADWSAYRLRSSATRPLQDYAIDDVLLIEDPEEAGLYLSRFRQTITGDNGTIVTTKRLYWRRSAGGELEIVAEDNG